jgi:hypothetical protein
MNKLHLGFEDITKIYAEALENETGMPIENLKHVFDYDSYELNYDSLADKIIIKILGAFVQFEMEDQNICVINYNDGRGWYLGY